MEKKKHISDEAWAVIAKQLYGQEEGTEAQMDADNRDVNEYAEISRTAEVVDRYFNLKRFDAERAYQYVRPKLVSYRQRNFPHIYQPVMKIAAALIVALLLASVGFYLGSHPGANTGSSGVTVNDYGISKIELADGSVVTLNRDTKINYPETFRADIREVEIEGEAFFEVQPDPERPFVIHAGQATIKVLGTSFNVNAYPQNEEIEVVVATGKVQVAKKKSATKQSDEIILNPGDKGVFVANTQELRKTKNENPNYLAWKTRDLVFDKTSLKEVISQLNNVYPGQVRLVDPELEQLLLTARFDNRPLDFILEVIALTHNLEIAKEEGQYVLKSAEN